MSKENYVDNAQFLDALVVHQKRCRKAKRTKRTPPRLPEYVGECFLKIAQHLSRKHNFGSYTYRDEMVSDAVLNCLQYLHCFDPRKSKNPFGYFTQVIYFAFIRKIQQEKKQTYIKYKAIEQMMTDNPETFPTDAGKRILEFDNVQEFIEKYDNSAEVKRQARRRNKNAKE